MGETATARKNAKTNKRVALQALKRKKRYEQQLQQIDGTLTTIEQQRNVLENANTNTEVLKNMGEASKALKAAHKNMDVDQVHDMMDDIAEQQDVAKEISEAISNPVAFGQEFDELELDEQEALDKQMLDIGPSVGLPDVPTAEPPRPAAAKAPRKEEEDPDMAE